MPRTYGTIYYDAERNRWHVQCEPHVRVWLKRLFPKVDLEATVLVLSATLANTADLEWATQRWPMVVDPKTARAAWDERIADHRAREAAVADIHANPAYQPPQFVDMALPARPYQRLGADQWTRLRRMMLGDDLGLGKTVTALAALSDPRLRPALVVTMSHLTRQWRREADRFLPELRTHVLRTGRATYQLEHLYDEGIPDLVICNYHKLDGWAPALAGVVKGVVFDECQEIRIERSDKYAAAKAIADGADYVLGMSATPVYNYGSEIWTIYNVLDESVFGTKGEFLAAWSNGATARSDGKSQPVDDPLALCAHLKETGAMLRRTRSDVGRELPALQTVVQHVDCDLSHIEDAKDKVAELARLLVSRSDLSQQDRFAYEREIDFRMRQATGVAKAPFVAEFVKLLLESGEPKVVLGGWHHAFYDVVIPRLKDYGVVRFTGEETTAQKDAARRRFIEDPTCRVIVMSVRSGAGLDGLQAVCRTVVHGELDWSPRPHEQLTGRVHRDGQPDPVMAYMLVTDEGSDPVLSETLGLKEIQSSGVIGREAEVFKADAEVGAVRRLAEAVLRSRAA